MELAGVLQRCMPSLTQCGSRCERSDSISCHCLWGHFSLDYFNMRALSKPTINLETKNFQLCFRKDLVRAQIYPGCGIKSFEAACKVYTLVFFFFLQMTLRFSAPVSSISRVFFPMFYNLVLLLHLGRVDLRHSTSYSPTPCGRTLPAALMPCFCRHLFAAMEEGI